MAVPTLNAANLAQMSDSNRRALQTALASGQAVHNWSDAQAAALRSYNQRFGSTFGGARTQPGGGGTPSGPSPGGGAGGGINPGTGMPGGVDLKALLGTRSVTDVTNNPQLLERLFHAAGFQGSFEDIMRQLDLGYSFAGAEQFRQNQASWGSVDDNPALHNVSMQSIVNDWPSLNRVVGEMMDMLSTGQDVQGLWNQRNELVPEWAPGVYDDVTAGGTPWTTELFGSPEINYTDPSQPLFGAGQQPNSLFGLTTNQAGELDLYQQMSAEELMRQIFPYYSAYYHRPAGAEAPGPMPMIGSTDAYEANPIRQSDAYQRGLALGLIGSDTPGLVGGSYGSAYNPLTGEGSTAGRGIGIGSLMASGQLQPEHLYPFVADWNANRDLVGSGLGLVGASAFTGDPSYYFSGPREQYNPAMLDAATIQRLLAVMGILPAEEGV